MHPTKRCCSPTHTLVQVAIIFEFYQKNHTALLQVYYDRKVESIWAAFDCMDFNGDGRVRGDDVSLWVLVC